MFSCQVNTLETFAETKNLKASQRTESAVCLRLPAALGDGLVNGFVNLLVVIVLVSGVLPHVGFE